MIFPFVDVLIMISINRPPFSFPPSYPMREGYWDRVEMLIIALSFSLPSIPSVANLAMHPTRCLVVCLLFSFPTHSLNS